MPARVRKGASPQLSRLDEFVRDAAGQALSNTLAASVDPWRNPAPVALAPSLLYQAHLVPAPSRVPGWDTQVCQAMPIPIFASSSLATSTAITTFGPPLLGGMLLGAATALLLLSLGRVAGVSGILGNLFSLPRTNTAAEANWRVAFLLGLVVAGLIASRVSETVLQGNAPRTLLTLAVAGVMVGFGTRLGSGCTSGHGVCGVSRFSPRSVVATCTFVAAGALTVLVVRSLGVSL